MVKQKHLEELYTYYKLCSCELGTRASHEQLYSSNQESSNFKSVW